MEREEPIVSNPPPAVINHRKPFFEFNKGVKGRAKGMFFGKEDKEESGWD